jgi:hypothetical protein
MPWASTVPQTTRIGVIIKGIEGLGPNIARTLEEDASR